MAPKICQSWRVTFAGIEGKLALRRTRVRWWFATMVSASLLIWVSGIFVADGPDPAKQPGAAQQLVCGLLALATAMLIVGILRQGVWVDRDGVTVRNVFRRYRLAWVDIAAIEPPPSYGAWRNAGIQIVLRSGERVSASLYAAGPFNRPTFADEAVSALRRGLEASRGRTSA